MPSPPPLFIGDLTMKWFTSDTHWGHANILKYDNRPFATIDEHDEELVRRWNAVVYRKLLFHPRVFVSLLLNHHDPFLQNLPW